MENACRKGSLCSHAHSPSELQNKPVLSKTRMCKQILRNGNCNEAGCAFAHEIDELIAANAFFRTKMCEFHLSGSGCKLGDKCRYAHSTQDLAEPVPAESSASIKGSQMTIPKVDFDDSPDTGYPMRKRGSVSSRSTMASGSYASLGSFAAYQQDHAPAPVVYVYPPNVVVYPQMYFSSVPYQD